MRGGIEPELSHPKWNAFRWALDHSGLGVSVLKLTIIANYNHGAFKSGDRLYVKQEVFKKWLSAKPESYFQDLQEEIANDRQEDISDSSTTYDMLNDYMNSPVITNRMEFATNSFAKVRVLELHYYSQLCLDSDRQVSSQGEKQGMVPNECSLPNTRSKLDHSARIRPSTSRFLGVLAIFNHTALVS